jgi:DNA-binding response OmpR family regulator
MKKILYIDDDSETAQLIVEDLPRRGFEVMVADDGDDGFMAILKGTADLVLCGDVPPNMSGADLLERLGALSSRIVVPPFVLMTALPNRDDELRARRLGADDYLIKPIDFDILELIIRARLAGVARKEMWPKLFNLSDCEIEIMTWAARGKTSAQIGKIVGLAKRTIDLHIENARIKLRATTRIEAVTKAVVSRIVDP